MKKLTATFLSGCFILLFSCQSKVEKPGDFKLLPLPQEFIIKGTSTLKTDKILSYYTVGNINLPVRGDNLKNIQPVKDHSKAQIIYSIDESLDLPAEGYTLDISRKQITITGKDNAGLLYGFMTLEQLIEDAKEQDVPLPVCSIKDYPLLSYRAIHLDMKHHLDKTEYYYKLLDKLAKYKVNAIIAEMEDKIKYERQPEVGSADALSINEWKKLSDYAIERNIEISPLIQGLGHASFILKHDKYKNLRDDPKSDWAFNPLDPETYKVQFDLYLDAMEATPYGRYLHVGGDEVHTTGRGSGISTIELQLTWLNKVCKFAEEHGRIPIFWDDMPLKYAGVYRPMFNTKLTGEEVDKIWEENEYKLVEFLDLFPKNCIYMRWNYSSPQAIGNSRAMEWFRKNGMQVMGATAGQTRWVLMPQNEGNMDNIKSFALSSISSGINGLLLTLWDDDSPHFELYMRGIIAFAEYTWTGEKRTKNDIKSAYRQREFSNTVTDSEYAFIDQLEKPVAFWNNALLVGNNRNQLHKLNNPADEAVISLPDRNNKGYWSIQYTKRLEQAAVFLQDCDSIASKIATMKSQAIRNTYTLEVYEQVNELVRFTPKALLALKAYDMSQNEEQEAEAAERIRQFPEEFMALRKQFELVYGKTRILTKAKGYNLYIPDQDHHSHLANQTVSFDWQFFPEILFLEKIENEF
ncbi:MAG: family 20 glycosylhydrolase [Bacteroidales bacterium]|nr:family 20 glycosylhydrolase [Bacteroidales bacterium]